ncbi:mitochondrial carrier [Mollisia scopiformis]|uniref:Mitochondrial thiamine pyrophosphate carrier 1 n=1 Tax=Mollisia scopiformis TaxID=149040 RepID=A0A194XS44_MOLSC|nr:mitochondrial carrier [Mollisia scopiformis]KUJ23120.1 mitochondrial carrier [Mollisia scopiformis]
MEIPESQNSRDARIEALWKKLDPQSKGRLDVNGLRKGLQKIDHPLKNANDMLQDVIKAMDKNGDEVIEYDEFRTFVEETEKELLSLFHSIDRDHNGKLDKGELRAAFKRAGLAVPNSKLDQFFGEVDGNHDGFITFEEWRNFLLFLPTHANPGLKAVLSYYSSTVTLNAEGDTAISEETLEGLGNSSFPDHTSIFFANLSTLLFGALFKIAEPPSKSNRTTFDSSPELLPPHNQPTLPSSTDNMEHVHAHFIEGTRDAAAADAVKVLAPTTKEAIEEGVEAIKKKSLLTEILPDPGYFAAGAVAGIVSRTSTAPLDRLKVYLIASVGNAKGSIDAVKKGDAAAAVRHIGQPLIDACKDLWRNGGIRNLFAGNGLNVLKVMPESAIKFGSYEAAKRGLAKVEGHENPQNINPYSKFVAGGVGGVISQLCVYPMDTLKFRMQCESVAGGPTGNKLIIATAKKMIQEGALRTSYRGLTMGLVGMFPYSAIDLGTFEFLKARLARYNAKVLGCHEEDAMPGSFATGCIGAFSGAFGATLVYPINLLRTRLQAQGTILHPPTYDGIWDVAQKTVKNEGFRGLFKGITPNLLKVVPAVSITYVVYENSKKIMHLK